MSRITFRQEMQEIKDDVLLLGSMVEDAVMKSVETLRDNNVERSRFAIVNDQYINRKRFEIETTIMTLMATQQPIARDLRTLAASLDVCAELERMGDYAKGIANINIRSGGLSMPVILREIYAMAEKAVDMLHRAMTTFADEDVETAKAIIQDDDIIDECYTRLYYDAVGSVVQEARNIERANYIIWVAHNLERLGDRSTNICECVIYMVTGERYEAISVANELVLSKLEN
jgi:phosphate transport system protein